MYRRIWLLLAGLALNLFGLAAMLLSFSKLLVVPIMLCSAGFYAAQVLRDFNLYKG